MAEIAVIGAGRIGGTLARKWSLAGHAVTLGARDPGKPILAELATGIGARTASIADAVSAAEVVLFAIPGASMAATVAALGADLDGKIVIDAANNIRAEVTNSAEAVTQAAPGSPYFRAFNTLGWELFDRPVVDGVQADLFFCGPDGPPRALMERLIADVGLRPVWMGGPEEAGVVDGLLRVWLTLVTRRGLARHMALKLIQDSGEGA